MIAQRIVAALLDSDEELMAELGRVATEPLYEIASAMERGEEITKKFPAHQQYQFDLEVSVKPMTAGKSCWVTIRWEHNDGTPFYAAYKKKGGGYFMVKTEQIKGFIEALGELVAQCAKPITSDEWVRKAYDNVLRWRYVSDYKFKKSDRARRMAQNRASASAYAYFR